MKGVRVTDIFAIRGKWSWNRITTAFWSKQTDGMLQQWKFWLFHDLQVKNINYFTTDDWLSPSSDNKMANTDMKHRQHGKWPAISAFPDIQHSSWSYNTHNSFRRKAVQSHTTLQSHRTWTCKGQNNMWDVKQIWKVNRSFPLASMLLQNSLLYTGAD